MFKNVKLTTSGKMQLETADDTVANAVNCWPALAVTLLTVRVVEFGPGVGVGLPGVPPSTVSCPVPVEGPHSPAPPKLAVIV
jgi:hypothetical protein